MICWVGRCSHDKCVVESRDSAGMQIDWKEAVQGEDGQLIVAKQHSAPGEVITYEENHGKEEDRRQQDRQEEEPTCENRFMQSRWMLDHQSGYARTLLRSGVVAMQIEE